MDLGMAIDARKVRKMAQPVTFRAEQPDLAANQKEPVLRAVGNMTTAAPLDLHIQVLINPGTPLLRVAFETDFVVPIERCLPEISPLTGPMRRVAVRTFQKPLDNPVVIGQIE